VLLQSTPGFFIVRISSDLLQPTFATLSLQSITIQRVSNEIDNKGIMFLEGSFIASSAEGRFSIQQGGNDAM